MSRRSPGVGGLSYVQANAAGRITRFTLSGDVMSARSRIERDYPNIRIWWDNDNEEHCVCQLFPGGEELVFATKTFHEPLIRARLERARNDRSDPLDDVDRYNAEVEKEQDRQFSEKMGDVGERLAFAFAQDGLTVRPRMTPLSVPLRKKRTLMNFDIPNRR